MSGPLYHQKVGSRVSSTHFQGCRVDNIELHKLPWIENITPELAEPWRPSHIVISNPQHPGVLGITSIRASQTPGVDIANTSFFNLLNEAIILQNSM